MRSRFHRFAARLAVGACLAGAALGLGLASIPAAQANETFESPEAAMAAFGNAVISSDETALKAILGDDFRKLIPPVGAEDRDRYLKAWTESHAVQTENDKLARIVVGNDGWTLPIPIVKSAAGWRFDTKAGVEEIRVRRIGRNELAVLQTMLAIYDAQREYASEDRDGDGLRRYAAKLLSSPGKHDGLYWPTGPGETPSPIGPALPAAVARSTSPDGYHGYRFKLLTSQGAHAPGGAFSYLVRGKLIGGFAVMAWPARFGDTGVMSFIINHNGQIYERNLGRNSGATAAKTTSFDPGPGWRQVSP